MILLGVYSQLIKDYQIIKKSL